MTAARDRSLSLVPRKLLDDLLGFTVLIWLGFMATVLVITLAIAYFSDISTSIWDTAASQIPQWYIAFIGGYLAYHHLPLHISHGITRRDNAKRGVVFTILYAIGAALMITIGYLLEAILYRLAGWPQVIADERLAASATAAPAIFVAYFLLFLLASALGSLIGAGFYRDNGLGVMTIIFALVLFSIPKIGSTATWGPMRIAERWIGDMGGWLESPPVAVTILLAVATYVIAHALTWPIIRDLPIRTKSS